MEKKKRKTKIVMGIIVGLVVGMVNGFLGGGGGMLCVPLLERVQGLPTKKAHASTMAIILPITIASVVIYIMKGNYQIQGTLIVGIGIVLGGIIGAILLKKLPSFIVGIVFSVLMIVAGVKMIV